MLLVNALKSELEGLLEMLGRTSINQPRWIRALHLKPSWLKDIIFKAIPICPPKFQNIEVTSDLSLISI